MKFSSRTTQPARNFPRKTGTWWTLYLPLLSQPSRESIVQGSNRRLPTDAESRQSSRLRNWPSLNKIENNGRRERKKERMKEQKKDHSCYVYSSSLVKPGKNLPVQAPQPPSPHPSLQLVKPNFSLRKSSKISSGLIAPKGISMRIPLTHRSAPRGQRRKYSVFMVRHIFDASCFLCCSFSFSISRRSGFESVDALSVLSVLFLMFWFHAFLCLLAGFGLWDNSVFYPSSVSYWRGWLPTCATCESTVSQIFHG